MNRDDDFMSLRGKAIGELCRLNAAALCDGRPLTAAEAARTFQILRDTAGDAGALAHRAFLQEEAECGGNDLARVVLDLLEPWWSENARLHGAVSLGG